MSTDTRTMFESGKLRVTAAMYEEQEPGEEFLPVWDDPEGQAAIAEMRRYLESGDLQYVTMVATVWYDGAEIGSDSLGGIDHGRVGTVGENGYTGPDNPGDPIISDAWEMAFAQYGPPVTHDAVGQRLAAPAPGTITGGSSLVSVIDEAIDHALKWAEANGNDEMRGALHDAARWIDPANPDYAATANDEDDQDDDEEYDHSRAKEDARNAYLNEGN